MNIDRIEKEFDIKTPNTSVNSSIDEYFTQLLGNNKRVIVFSPHLDDAVLSAGSLICHLAQNNIPVIVVSVFTKGSDIQSKSIETMLNWAGFSSAEDYFQKRQAEDHVAIGMLGTSIKIVHLGLTDAAWRTHEGNPIYPTTQLTDMNPVDKPIFEELKKKMTGYKNEDSIIFAPLSRGNHVDHRMTRDAALRTFDSVILFEDFPYSAQYGDEDLFVQKYHLKSHEWTGEYETKKKAILAYKTQIKSLFKFSNSIQISFEKYFAA